jgi:hypothetical protein
MVGWCGEGVYPSTDERGIGVVTAVYAIVLVAGIIALLIWVARTAIADTVEGWEKVDPEARFGRRGRTVVAAAMGFGLAGMSATFAGWAAPLAFVGALLGAGFLVAVAVMFGPEGADDPAEPPT